jgi:hypothetical protein
MSETAFSEISSLKDPVQLLYELLQCYRMNQTVIIILLQQTTLKTGIYGLT